jgi:VanZ family protein
MPSSKYAGLSVASAWALMVAVIYLSLSTTIIQLPGDPGGRYAHVAAYTLLMFSFAYAYPNARAAVVIAAALLALGIAIEYFQLYFGRNFERADMVADAVGIALGWLLGLSRTRIFIERRRDAA